MFDKYGFCDKNVTDNGKQFTSGEFAESGKKRGSTHIRTAPAHPQLTDRQKDMRMP